MPVPNPQLQELAKLAGGSDVEAIDEFLNTYSKAVPEASRASMGSGPSAARLATPQRTLSAGS
eukprot:136183-Chlamydomonas_euryale.AAC.1